jgi:hypothetical protein
VEKGSQSRFLMAKLNPSVTQSTHALFLIKYLIVKYILGTQQQGDEPPVFTEDVSLKVLECMYYRL